MATSLIQNITITSHHMHEGEDRTVRHDVVDSSDVAVDMTGWALRWELYDSAGTSKFTKTTGSGIVIGNGADTGDRATVTIDAADTDALAAGTYHYELARTDSGNKIVLAMGFVQIEAMRA